MTASLSSALQVATDCIEPSASRHVFLRKPVLLGLAHLLNFHDG